MTDRQPTPDSPASKNRTWPRELRRRPMLFGAALALPVTAGLVGLEWALDTALRDDTTTPGPPRIVTRQEWGADESLRGSETLVYAPIKKLIVHHSDTTNNDPNPMRTLRGILRTHIVSNGWNDIAYNFLIDEAGNIYEGRRARNYSAGEPHDGMDRHGEGVVGAHAKSHNTGTVGICLLGTLTGQPPTPAALSSLLKLLRWECLVNRVDPLGNSRYRSLDTGITRVFPNICGHADVVTTRCPGETMRQLLEPVRLTVADSFTMRPQPTMPLLHTP